MLVAPPSFFHPSTYNNKSHSTSLLTALLHILQYPLFTDSSGHPLIIPAFFSSHFRNITKTTSQPTFGSWQHTPHHSTRASFFGIRPIPTQHVIVEYLSHPIHFQNAISPCFRHTATWEQIPLKLPEHRPTCAILYRLRPRPRKPSHLHHLQVSTPFRSRPADLHRQRRRFSRCLRS